MSERYTMEHYYVKAFRNLLTPLYQIWDVETDKPVNPLWFYLLEADALKRIRETEGSGG